MNRKSWRTILLTFLVAALLFSLFVALPGIVPAFDTADVDKVIWACTLRGQPPVKYDTWIWNEPVMPEGEKGNKMDVVQDSDNENAYTISGYLHVGQFLKPEDDGGEALFVMPIFNQLGVLKNTGMVMEVTQVYADRDESEIVQFKTDGTGRFDQFIQIDPASECFRVTFTFGMKIIEPEDLRKPVEIYMGCQQAYGDCTPVQLERVDRVYPWWLYLVGGILFVGLLVIGYWYVKTRVKFGVAIEGAEEIGEGDAPEVVEDVPAGGDTELLDIHFPEIDETLPTVWGVNESLEIKIRAIEGVDVSGTIDIEWDDRTIEQYQPDSTGEAVSLHTYRNDGTYVITAGYRSLSGKEVSSWRKVRIVDYREEIVRLFDELVAIANLEDAGVKPEMTPREVERLLIRNMGGVSVPAVQQIILIFEEANYSTHLTGRDQYIAMYKAMQEVIDYDG